MISMYLIHHGVKGQKWGVRRYQNYDGTLTSLGRRRKHGYKSTPLRKILAPELRKVSMYTNREKRLGSELSDRLGSLQYSYRSSGKIDKKLLAEAERYNTEYSMAQLRNASLKNYTKRVSTGKLFIQSILMPKSALRYREAKARGLSSSKAFFESRSAVSSELANRLYYGMEATQAGIAGKNYVYKWLKGGL